MTSNIKIIKLIDYIYLNNYIGNSLIFPNQKNNVYNDWKMFSNCHYDESINILFFLKNIRKQDNFSYENLLLAIHIYMGICKKHAHQIDNYTFLFATIFVSVSEIMCIEFIGFIGYEYLAVILNVTNCKAKKMICMIGKFMNSNEIYFGSKEKEIILKKLLD